MNHLVTILISPILATIVATSTTNARGRVKYRIGGGYCVASSQGSGLGLTPIGD